MKYKAIFYGGPADGKVEPMDGEIQDTIELEMISQGADFVPSSYIGNEEISTGEAAGLHHLYIRSLSDSATGDVAYTYEGVGVG